MRAEARGEEGKGRTHRQTNAREIPAPDDGVDHVRGKRERERETER